MDFEVATEGVKMKYLNIKTCTRSQKSQRTRCSRVLRLRVDCYHRLTNPQNDLIAVQISPCMKINKKQHGSIIFLKCFCYSKLKYNVK